MKNILTLTKKQKADIFAWAIHFGYWDYFDQCEWIPHLHKYRYVNASQEYTHYLSQKYLAHEFDTVFEAEEQEQLTKDFNDYQNELKLRRE